MLATVRRILIPATLVALSLPSLATTAQAAMGDLDTTFDTDGKVTTPVGSATDTARAVVIQSDGKIVTAGYVNSGGTNSDFALVRYTTTGALDPTFGSGGIVITPTATNYGAYAVAIQTDGKIVAAGYGGVGSTVQFALVRYTTTGALDTTFGSGGTVTTPMGSGGTAVAETVAIQDDGKIVVAGYAFVSPNDDFALARYTPTGALDPTFGSGGKVTTPIGAGLDEVTSVNIQDDGKIVAAGNTVSTTYDFALARYTTVGALDGSFGAGGKVITPIGSGNDLSLSAAIQDDGKIVAAGPSFNGSNDDFALARYTSSGALDGSFGSGGKVTTPVGSGTDWARAVAIQDDGKIVAAGYAAVGSINNFAVTRYLSSGALDSTFGAGGKVTTAFGSSSAAAFGMALYDGRIVLAGSAGGNLVEDFAVARYIGLPGVSVSDVSVTEGDSGTVGATFTLTLSQVYDQPITVDFSTRDGTAKAATDYEARQGTRLFLPGQKKKTVTIFVNGDTLQEGNETFSLHLADPQQAYIIDDTGLATIVDNDLPAVSVSDVSKTEGNSGTTQTYGFKVTLSKAGTNTVTVTYTTVDGTAVAPGDYTAKSGTLTFAPGAVSKTVNVIVKGDNTVEPNETFTLHVTGATFATVADADGLGTIVNND